MNYIQCEIKNGNLVEVTWLPENKITIGASLTIDSLEPSKGWIVTKKYSDIKISENYINRNRDESRDFKTIEIAGRKSYKNV